MINPLDRNYSTGTYWVRYMEHGAWVYLMDDFGNAVPINTQTVRGTLLFPY